MNYRLAGHNRKLSSREINTMTRVIDNVDNVDDGTFDPRAAPNQMAWFVRVRNTAGVDRQRYELMSLEDPLWTPQVTDGADDVPISAVRADTTRPIIVLAEDIAQGQEGYAVALGVALCKVKASGILSNVWGSPGAFGSEDHLLVPAQTGSMRILGHPAGSEVLLPVIVGVIPSSSTLVLARTSNIGIPARSGLQMGNAICQRYSVAAGGLKTLGGGITIWNDSGTNVPGNTDIVAAPGESGLLIYVE